MVVRPPRRGGPFVWTRFLEILMSTKPWRGVLIALALASTATASAQESATARETAGAQEKQLAEGTWTGTVYPPNDELIELEYEVSYGEEGLSIVLHPPAEVGVGPLPADDPVYEALTLTFTLLVGDTVMCTLFEEEDGHLEGDCVGSDGEPALMTMFPPAE